jgi:hypothetical protein
MAGLPIMAEEVEFVYVHTATPLLIAYT